MRFEWVPLSESQAAVRAVYWPGPMECQQSGGYTLLNWQQGIRIPNDWPVATTKTPFNGMLGTAGAYMPWFAQVEPDGAYLAIAETPEQCGVRY